MVLYGLFFFSIIPITILNSLLVYEEYENCLVRLPDEQWNHSKTIYQQNPCLLALQNEADMFDLYPYPNKLSPPGSNTPLKYLPKVCRIGRGGAYHPKTNRMMRTQSYKVVTETETCKSRSFYERIIHKESFNLMPIAFANYTSDAYAASLLETLNSRGINSLVAIGDSISEQLFTFLVCDTIRDRVPIMDDVPESIEQNNHIELHFQLPSTQSDFVLLKHKVGWPGGDDLVVNATNYAQIFYASMWDILVKTTSLARELKRNNVGGTAIIINFAFHVFRKFRHESIPMLCKAIVDFAKSNPSVFIVFREASARNGEHRGRGLKGNNENDIMCCERLTPALNKEEFGRKINIYIMEEFARVDPAWRQVVGWAGTFDITDQLFNFHIEFPVGASNADCAHYVYFPRMMNPIWNEYSKEITRLVKLKDGTKV